MPFSFLNAALLAGIAAAAIPILIHLFSRRKVAKVPFSSVRFLEEIARRRVRKMRLTQWIILAMRVLAVALLAFALGRPAFRGDFAFGKSRGESAAAIVLDRSYSMRTEGETQTLWQKAAERAQETMDALEPQDTVFLLGLDPKEGGVEPYPNRTAAQQALRGTDVGFGTTDLAGAVRRAGAALAEATALNKELFIISDFQKSGVSGPEDELPDLVALLDPEVRVFLVPVGEGPLDNTAIEDARLEGSTVEQHVRVQTAHHGAAPLEELPVTVEAGSEVLGETAMSLVGDVREVGDIPLTRLPGEGEDLTARIARDRLNADDRRYIPATGTAGIQTWVVQDPAQPSPYLALALNPAGDQGRFIVQRIPPEALTTADLSDVRLIVLDNVTLISREAVMRLRQWQDAGGVVFIALGDRVDLRYYNESILPALFPGVSLGNLLGTDEATGASYTLTPRIPGHAAFSGFQVKTGEPVTGATFWRIVEVRNEPGVRTLAEFGPGLPALVQGDRALLFASSLDGRWSNFPTHAAFLPLLHQSLDATLTEGEVDRVLVGEPVEGLVDRALIPTGADVVCVGPEGLVLDVTSQVVPRGVLLRSDPAPVPGFYAIRVVDRPVIRRSVNVDTRLESDLTPLTADELRRVFPGEKVQVIEAGAVLGTPVREARYGREIWRELVLVVLLLMISEGWLSRRGVT